jgi:hypothetical protein
MQKIIYLIVSAAELLDSMSDVFESMSDLVDSLRLLGSLLLQVIPTLL